jgi:RNB domain
VDHYDLQQMLSARNEFVPDDKRAIVKVLSRHAGRRFRLISTFPCMAEVFVDGRAMCVQLVSFDGIANKFTVRQSDNEMITIDFGQLTSVLDDGTVLRSFHEDCSRQEQRRYEVRLNELYYSYVGRGRSNLLLAKKRLASLGLSSNDEAIVRSVLKAGAFMTRLVDSSSVVEELGPFAEIILSDDAKAGGRFKRFPSLHVATTHDGSLLIVNGGWLVVDRSARFTVEARKFTARNGAIETLADRQIVRKLECLAMGELFERDEGEKAEVDVQEVLKELQLDQSPAGAKEALIRLGFWSTGEDIQKRYRATFQPWKPEILLAANTYVRYLQSTATSANGDSLSPKLPCILIDLPRTSFRDDGIGLRPRQITGRRIINGMKWEILVHITDMSDIYCPHPAINMTHADEQQQSLPKALAALQDAARTRGYSRYDLPIGPLHLLPPVVLGELSLDRSKRSVTLWAYIDERSGYVLDSGVERMMIPAVQTMTYAEATDVLKGKKENQALTIMARILEVWGLQHSRHKGIPERPVYADNNLNTEGHTLVDRALDLYSSEAIRLLRRRPVPSTPGAEVWRGGRLGTGVLRRYVDGQTQRQLLAILCTYGGAPLTLDECKEIGMTANDARNSITNLKSYRSNKAKTWK